MTRYIHHFHVWYLYSCRRIAIHPFALPALLLVSIGLFFALPAPCMSSADRARLASLKQQERQERLRQLYAFHESRDPCDVQERILLERIDSARTEQAPKTDRP